jgi:hypothetical protein
MFTLFRGLAVGTLGAALTASTLLAPSVAGAQERPYEADPVQPATVSSGLFGTADATYDGTYRQSYALLGLQATDAPMPQAAIDWLMDQQCANGSFTAYREDTAGPCPGPNLTTYTGPDTNSTALAAMALKAVGKQAAANRAIRWLRSQQFPGGGWEWIAGLGPDSVSTGLALQALRGVPGTGQERQRAVNFLRRHIQGCDAPAASRFGVVFQVTDPAMNPDPLSASQALVGLSGTLPVNPRPQRAGGPTITCRADGRVASPKPAVARGLIRAINTGGGTIESAFSPGETDWNATALATLGLISSRQGGIATRSSISALRSGVNDYIGDDDRPAAMGTLLLITHAAGTSPQNFGGVNLVDRLLSTLQD